MSSDKGTRRRGVAALTVYSLVEEGGEARGRKRNRETTRQWIRRCKDRGFCSNIVHELMIEDTASYKEMMRMTYEDVLVSLKLIDKDITPKQISGGNPIIAPKARLTLTIRFLATGETYRSLAFQFRISVAAT